MATLADEFLADLMEDGDVEGLEEDEVDVKQEIDTKSPFANLTPDAVKATPNPLAELKATHVRQVSKLIESNELQAILKEVEKYRQEEKSSFSDGDPEYDLMVRANEIVVDITHDIADIHKFIRDIYSKRFPELESLVLHPLDYARTILLLGNDLGKVNDLAEVLPATNVITISMTASSTTGKPLDQADLDRVFEACHASLELDQARQKILSYVEGRMKVFAPNLSAIVGSEIAAKLIGAAGGLHNLANMPSTTLFVLGKKKRTLDGFSRSTAVKHQGYIMECDLLRKVPADLETKTCRIIANKCTLAARIDLQHDQYLNGEQGARFREDIEEKLNKWQMPPPLRKVKVLPRPDANEHKTKRGGEKLRRHKEKFQVTELRKRANRMMFGQVQEEYGNTMKTLGLLGQEGSGVLRARVDEDKGFKIKPKKWHKGKRVDRTPGLATSVFAMTEVQGLELANPMANKEKQEEEAQSYFSNATSFINVKK